MIWCLESGNTCLVTLSASVVSRLDMSSLCRLRLSSSHFSNVCGCHNSAPVHQEQFDRAHFTPPPWGARVDLLLFLAGGCSRNSGFVELRTKKANFIRRTIFRFFEITHAHRRRTIYTLNQRIYKQKNNDSKQTHIKQRKWVSYQCLVKIDYSSKTSNKCHNFR